MSGVKGGLGRWNNKKSETKEVPAYKQSGEKRIKNKNFERRRK